MDDDKILPDHLRQRLDWGPTHDAIARKIMREFNLILPRDREIIRQLTFVRARQGPLEWM